MVSIFSSSIELTTWQEESMNKKSCCCYLHSSVTYQCLFLILILISTTSGGLESNIICRFSKQNRTEFWTGEFIEGNIEFNNSVHQKLKLKSIDVELLGVLVYKNVMPGRYKAKVATGRKIFFDQRLNLNSTNTQGSSLLPYGHYNWPFRFFLNDFLPPTLKQKKSSDSFIHYYLQIIFVRGEWYKRNIKKIIPVVVRHRSTPVNSTAVEAQTKNWKGIHFRVTLEKSVVVVGQNISFDIEIQNPKQVLINRVLVILSQHVKLGPSQDRRLDLFNETLKTIDQFQNTHLRENFQLHVPHTLPPTFSFYFPSNDGERPLVISYELRFEAHLHGFYTNIQLQIPLIIIDQSSNN